MENLSNQTETPNKLIQMFQEFKREAEQAKASRMTQDQINFEAYNNKQDFSAKVSGQSTEFLPKTSEVVEVLVAFIKKALISFGDWFDIELDGEPSPKLKKFFREYLDKIDIVRLITDAVKSGVLKSRIIAKVFSEREKAHIWKMRGATNSAELIYTEINQIKVDLINPLDFFPDPTPNKFYEIHSVEVDYSTALSLAKAGAYDITVLETIKEDYKKEMDEASQKAEEANQDTVTTVPTYRRKIKIDEYWGKLLNEFGEIEKENIVFAIANDKYIIKKPKENPRLDKESPFVTASLITIPFSTWHKALMDDAVALNFAINELFNLMLDGGISAVWGVSQIRTDDLKDPSQVSDGIPQGEALAIKSTVPYGAKVLERVSTGQIPQDTMQMFYMLEKEHQAASRVSEIRQGMLASRAVKATEVVEAQQSSSVVFDSFISTIEADFITPLLVKIWNSMLQISDIWELGELIQFMDEPEALTLSVMTPKQRYEALAGKIKIKVYGLSAVLNRAREFQKLMALLNVVATNQVLAQAFMKKYSLEKVLDQIIKSLNINPEMLQLSKSEIQELTMQAQSLNNEQKQAEREASESAGVPSITSEVNQIIQGGANV